MVRIRKKVGDIPEVLRTRGAAAIAALKQMTSAKRKAHKYDSKLYGGKTVKDVLKRLQHDKCCFCEATVSHVTHGDVEHYRPKAGWTQTDEQKLTKPGYYWLAYDFDNLYLSCQICNQVFKKNYFPLATPGQRVTDHTGDLSQEDPLIIDPGHDDPEDFLTFNQEMAVARNDHAKGLETIKRTGLNRPATVSARFEYLETLEVLAQVARGPSAQAAPARAHFKKVGQPKRLFSLMVRENFPDLV